MSGLEEPSLTLLLQSPSDVLALVLSTVLITSALVVVQSLARGVEEMAALGPHGARADGARAEGAQASGGGTRARGLAGFFARGAPADPPAAADADASFDERVEQVRALVKAAGVSDDPDDPSPHSADRELRRYLRAVGGSNVEHAARRVVATQRWRLEHRPWTWTCTFCEKSAGHHTWRQVGYDRNGRPVVYSCLAQAATHRYTAACAVEHIVFAIEQAVRTMPATESGWVWVCDFSGFSIRAVDLSMTAAVVRVVAEHYPERLALFMCVNAPRVFVPVWRAMRAFTDPVTFRKADFVCGEATTRQALQELAETELAEWLLAELSLNLQRPLPPSQSKGGFWRPPPEGVAHDPRACPSFVAQHIAPAERGEGWRLGHLPHPNIRQACEECAAAAAAR